MADNTAQTGSDTIATDDVTTLNGSASSGVKVQRVKVGYGDDNTFRDVSTTFPLPVEEAPGQTGTITTVTTSGTANTNSTLLAADQTRRSVIIYVSGTAPILVGFGATTISATLYSVQITPGSGYEVPAAFASLVMNVRSATASVTVNVTTVV